MEEITLTNGGIYLAKLDPAKHVEIGKIRPVVVLTSQIILNAEPPLVFICPLSSRTYIEFSNLHVKISPRDDLQVTSYALVEHCRAITVKRLLQPKVAQLNSSEMQTILQRLQRILGI